MKIAVVGATGTIGSEVVEALRARGHEVLEASRSSTHRIDLEDPASIDAFYAAHPDLEAVVSAAGRARFGPLTETDDPDWQLGLESKLMGQVNLVRKGAKALSAPRFVLTSGILAESPWPNTAPVAMVNGAVESFARAAALDLEGGHIAVVSPPLVRETAEAMGMDPQGPTAADVAQAYVKALESAESGAVVKAG